MAKHVILESYTFTPSTNTIVVTGKYLRREQLMLITNVTRNTVIYNFSDPSLTAASFTNTVSTTTGQETTTIVTTYSTSAMASTDKLSILYEETYTEMTPAETSMDPVGKFRVSTPQALIDTDFEYGVQGTKWESINLLNNRPSAFYDPTATVPLSAMTATGSVVSVTLLAFTGGTITASTTTTTVTGIASTAGLYPGMVLTKQSGAGVLGANCTVVSIDSTTQITITATAANTLGTIVFVGNLPAVGTPIFIQGSLDQNADGWWLCESQTVATGIFTYTVTTAPAAALLDSTTKTYLFTGTFYTGAAIPAATNAIAISAGVATVTTTNPHGLQIGNGIYIVGTTGAAGTLNSSWVVTSTPTVNTFTFTTAATGTITAVLNASIYPRALGYTIHRAFDGGVQFTNVSPYQGYQVIRQTRRYFRYQSGKAIQFSTGSIIKPPVTVVSLTASGTTITATTRFPHGMLAGTVVQITGADQTAYNGQFTVLTAPTLTTFTYTALTAPTLTPATMVVSGSISANPYSWYGSKNRIGMFDTQNGMFFEFDGQTLYAVKRSSITQGSGTVAVTNGSATVTGTNTYFSTLYKPGNWIVIRGQSYVVQSITSDTQLFIYPEYRGVTASNCVPSLTIDTRYPQSTWNIDRCDGTGASGYNLDLTKMQMLYIDYTWYGAGGIRFGFKNNRGEVIYCHRIPNNNLNQQAWMRSGNMCARYETNTMPPYTYLTATLASSATTGATISVADTTGWPNSGVAIVTASGQTAAAIEFISYSAKTATSLTIAARAQTGGNVAAQTFTLTGVTSGNLSGTAPIQVELYSPQNASTVSHWGSSVIMDGRYDDDKSYLFVAGQQNIPTNQTNLAAQETRPILSLRISPSVDSGITGTLGQREIINRMQLVLRALDIWSTGTAAVFLITLRLNATVTSNNGTFAPVGGSSLAQVCYHNIGGASQVTGGEVVYGFFSNTPGISTLDLTQVRDLGTSILGGGTALTFPTTALNKFPDGPDILTICATNVSAVTTNSIVARISWTEAQA